MNSYSILKNIHKIGHLMTGEVVGYRKKEFNGFFFCDIELKADTKFKAIVSLFGKVEEFKEEVIPKRGSIIEAVIKNHVDDTLYLSMEPKDLQQTRLYKAFYQFIETLREGTITAGIVKKIVPFGIFVDLSCPYLGLIDNGHVNFNNGNRLPNNFHQKMKEGDEIQCIISYFRFDERQIGLGWLENNK